MDDEAEPETGRGGEAERPHRAAEHAAGDDEGDGPVTTIDEFGRPTDLLDPPRSRIRRAFAASKGLIRLIYRDPEHISERLMIFASDRLSEESREWAAATQAAHPDQSKAKIAENLRTQSAHIARVDGAIAGTPFYIALVPGYLTYLVQEMRMTLRTAALYDRDPGSERVAAEMLALRRVHPDIDTAAASLSVVRATPIPEHPDTKRPLRTWIHSVYLLLVFGGFLSPSDADEAQRSRLRTILGLLIGAAMWVVTWVFPVTFMVMMAWGCESHSRQLGRRTQLFYGEERESVQAAIADADRRQDPGHDKRSLIRAVVLFLSVAVPIAFIAYVDHVRKTTGVNGLGALGALVALSLVIATLVISNRRAA
jgi:hypothetical protein